MVNQYGDSYPSAQTTLVILLGASTWPHDPENFQEHDAFLYAAEKVEHYFRQTYGLLQPHFRSYFNDPRPATEITRDIYFWLKMVKDAANDLIIYYIGHAKHTVRHRELYLAIRDTQAFDPEGTSLRVESLVSAIKYIRLRRYYIFDCCFAATAIPDLQGTNEGDLLRNTLGDAEIQTKGWTALFSSGKKNASVILPDKTNTYFSEALLQALQTFPSSDAPFSFANIWPEINRQRDSLYQRNRFHPDAKEVPPRAELASGDLADMPIFFSSKQASLPLSRQLPRSEVKNITLITQFIEHKNEITALALSPDNEILVSGDQRGKVRIWEIAKKNSFLLKSSADLLLGPKGAVTGLVFHPEGRTFFVGWHNGRIKIYKCLTGECIHSIYAGHKKGIEALAVSPDGLVFISAGTAVRGVSAFTTGYPPEWSLRWWKYPKTDKSIHTENYSYIEKFRHYDSDEGTPSIAFSPKGHIFAASSSTGVIRIWDIFEGKERLSLKNKASSRDSFVNISFHPKEILIAAINKEGQCLIWDVPTAEIQNVLNPPSGKITALAFSPDSSYLAVAHSNGVISLWNPFSGELLHSFQAHEQSISALVYSHDGYNLISGSLDRTIKVWGTEN